MKIAELQVAKRFGVVELKDPEMMYFVIFGGVIGVVHPQSHFLSIDYSCPWRLYFSNTFLYLLHSFHRQ